MNRQAKATTGARRKAAPGLVLALGLVLVQPLGALEPPCESGSTLGQYLLDLSTEASERRNQVEALKAAKTAEAAKGLKKEAAERANGDGIGGSRLDLLRQAFVALDLGGVEDEEGKLVFNFNPERFEFPWVQISPRVVAYDPVLYAGLEKEIDTLADAAAQSRKDALKKGFEDLDDTEVGFRWTLTSDMPDTQLERVARRIFDAATEDIVTEDLANRIAESVASVKAALAADGVREPVESMTVKEVCAASPTAKKAVEDLVAGEQEVTAALAGVLDRMEKALTEAHYFDLADLMQGAPRWSGETAYRFRDGPTGPDEWSASLHFEIGTVTIKGWQRWAEENGRDEDGESVGDYLIERGNDLAPTFLLKAGYSSVDDFDFPVEEDGRLFVQAESHKLTGEARGGIFLDRSRDRRLDLIVTGEDARQGRSRNDRLVVNLTWVEMLTDELAKLLGGSELSVTAVWANKPEFRGEVDKDFGVRAGLKWSLGGVKGKD